MYAAQPTIDKPLQDLIVIEGLTAKFEAVVDGIPFPEVSWSKDGSPLSSNDNVSFERKDNSVSCTIMMTNRTDFGAYKVKCSNELGEVESEAKLLIHGKFHGFV